MPVKLVNSCVLNLYTHASPLATAPRLVSVNSILGALSRKEPTQVIGARPGPLRPSPWRLTYIKMTRTPPQLWLVNVQMKRITDVWVTAADLLRCVPAANWNRVHRIVTYSILLDVFSVWENVYLGDMDFAYVIFNNSYYVYMHPSKSQNLRKNTLILSFKQ